MAARVGMLNAILSANTSQFKAGMKEASASAKNFAKSIEAQNRKLKKLGKQLTKTGKEISLKLSLPIAALGVLATKTFAGFEQEMAKVKAISGATGKTFSDLQKLAEDLGASTRFTASEVATLELNYSKLGFAPEQIQKITASTLDLALATGEDLAESAQIAGATLRGFGKLAAEMPAVIDVMALSFSSSALNLEKFKDSMKTVAPVAKAAKASLEETTAILSVLVDAGLDASTSGTSLRNIFLELADKGISWNDAMGKIKNSTNKLKTAQDLFGKRASTAALIIAENSDRLETLTDKYEKAGGAAKRMAAIMDATLEGAFLKVKSAVEAVGIEFGRRLAPILTVIAEKAAALAGWFKSLEPATKDIILVVSALVIALGPLLIALGFLTSTILPALITGFALLTGPVGLVILGIAALAGGYLLFSKNAEVAATKQELLNGVLIDAKKAVAAEGVELDRLLKIAKEDLLPRKLRLKAIKDINAISPKYLGNIRLENINSQETANAVNAHKDAILAKAKAQAISERIGKLAVIQLDIELEREKLLTRQIKLLTSGEDSFKTSFKDGVKILTSHGVALKGNKEQIDKNRSSLKLINKEMSNLSELLTETEAKELKIKVPTLEITPSFFKIDTSKAKIKGKLKIEMELEVEPAIESSETAFRRFNDTIKNAAKQSAQELEDSWGNAMRNIENITREIASAISQVWGGLSNVFAQAMRNDEIALQNKHSKEIALVEEAAVAAEEEQLRLDDNFARQTERIANSVLSQKEKDSQLLSLQSSFNNSSFNLDDRISKKRKALAIKMEKEKKKLAQKRAETDKASAIIGAIVNTALAVTGALASLPGPAGILLAAVVGLLGATEIALIESQPTALAKGGIVTSPTLALIGEAGPEAVVPLPGNLDFANLGNQEKELITRITADEIHLILKRRDRNLSFT